MKNKGKQNSDEMDISLAINELLQVHLQDDPNPSTYRSRIENIIDDKMLITWPTFGGIRMLVHADQMLNFSLAWEGNAYSFTGLVDSTLSEPLPQVVIIISSDIFRVQRRQNVRIKSLVSIELSGEIRGASDSDASVPFFVKTTAFTISAGGISIRISKGIPDGTLLEAKIILPDQEPIIKVPCRVVYSEPVPNNPDLHLNGIQFLAITEKERSRIVRHIYRTQLKNQRA
jgi:c-di-GMP-binding flagellar brake protein YcgR